MAYSSLVVVLVVGLYWDDGAGMFYGSGIEVFGFVLLPLLEGYTIGIAIYTLSSVSTWTAHAAAGLAGALLLFPPVLCRALGAYASGWANTRRQTSSCGCAGSSQVKACPFCSSWATHCAATCSEQATGA